MSPLWLVLLASLVARADDRDDEIFGSSSSSSEGDTGQAPAEAPPQEAPPSDAALGGPVLSDQQIANKLLAKDSRFTVGGLAYLRLDGSVAEGDDLSTVALSSPSFVDLYGDARPNDRLRFYLRGRLYDDLTVQSGDTDAFGNTRVPTRIALDQLWLTFDIAHKVFVTAGRQRVKWGVGRLWNPTDFLAPSALDALTVFDERMGVGLVKVLVPVGATGTNIYAIAQLEGAAHPDDIGGALRVEQLLGPVEIALDAYARKDRPDKLGGQVSFPLWLFDLKGEVAVQHGVSAPTWQGNLDLATLSMPTAVDRSEDWVPQALASLDLTLRYSDQDSITFGAEYFFNDLGYADASLYPWLLVEGQFTPFYLGRHYVAAYAYLPAPGRANHHSFTLTGLSNLSDQTVVGRLDWSATVLTELSINAYAQVHGGKSGGEFDFALDVPPITGVLDAGLTVPRPLVDLGVGAQARF